MLTLFFAAAFFTHLTLGNAVPRELTCPPGESSCWEYRGKYNRVEVCADLQTSERHCGSCGNSCYGVTENPVTCEAGACKCNFGEVCWGSYCPDFNNDKWYCGGCSTSCSDNEICSGGKCVGCPSGQDGCYVPESNRYECRDIMSDPKRCGTCWTQCPEGVACVNGACDCPAGKVWCPNMWDCIDVQNDANNCGACNNYCESGPCRNGKCVGCDGGQTWCGSWLGCVNTQNDNNNCGQCWNYCTTGSNCVNGECSGGNTGCPPGQIKCNWWDQDCVNTANDNQNCGSCGVQCDVGKNCVNGSCV